MAAARDVIIIIGFVFALAIALFITHFFVGSFVNTITQVPVINETQSAAEAFQGIKTTSNKYDYLIFGVFMALSIALIVTGWLLGGYPIFMIAYFLLLVIAIVISPVLSNVWEEVTTTVPLVDSLPYFPLTNFLMSNLPYFALALGFLGVIAMFARSFTAVE